MPRQVAVLPDQPLNHGVVVVCDACDDDDQFAADVLREAMVERGVPAAGSGALRIVLQRLAKPSLIASFTDAMKAEGYTITSTPGTLTLTGATAEGVFYAAQTAAQMVESTPPAADGSFSFVLHAANIHDWPAMHWRGLSDDQSRGPVNTLEFDKKMVRTLAAYKDNLYSPYFENTQQYASNPLPAPPGGFDDGRGGSRAGGLCQALSRAGGAGAGSVSGICTMTLVYEQYQRRWRRRRMERCWRPDKPGSLDGDLADVRASWRKFIRGRFCMWARMRRSIWGWDRRSRMWTPKAWARCTWTSCSRSIQTLRPLNRRLLFWGDIAQDSPDLLKAMPESFKKDTIAIAWTYNPRPTGFARYLKPYTEAGFETWVSPGINNWSRVYPNYNMGLANIQQFTRDGQAAGSTGPVEYALERRR